MKQWLYDNINEQAAKNTYDDPVLTSSQIYERMSAMTKGYAAIMNKPKPPPPTPDESKTTSEGGNNQSEDNEGKAGEDDSNEGENSNEEKNKTDSKGGEEMDVEPQEIKIRIKWKPKRSKKAMHKRYPASLSIQYPSTFSSVG